MAACSRVLTLLVVVSSVVALTGCGTGSSEIHRLRSSDGPAATSAPAPSVVPGSRARAQRVVDAAEKRLLEDGSARYTMWWETPASTTGGLEIGTGDFDLLVPAASQVVELPGEFRVEYRLVEEHAWALAASSEGEALAGCWIHMTRGDGEDARLAAVPPPALMLVDPAADGFVAGAADDGAERVAVDLLLDEAAPAVMPRIANKSVSGIDPAATVPGVVTVRDGRYAALEYRLGDVLGALDPADVPDEIAAFGETDGVVVRFEYADHGAPVDVRPPPEREVIDLGDQADLLAGGPAGAPSVGPCAAAVSEQ